MRAVECLLAAGRGEAAVERARSLVAARPTEGTFARLLAKAFLARADRAWSELALTSALARDQGDCESASWLAWLHLQRGDLELAGRTLAASGCPATEAERTRWLLLRAVTESVRQDHAATRAALVEAAKQRRAFPEDQRLLAALRRRLEPGWEWPWTGRVDLEAGTTSNGTAGAPTDPGEPGGASGLARANLTARLLLPDRPIGTPAIEIGVRGHRIADPTVRELSYLEISSRFGVLEAAKTPGLLVGYRAEALYLDRSTGARYSAAHRLELEAEGGRRWSFFAGAGRRSYRDERRTRWEADGGLARRFRPAPRWELVLAGSLRYFAASHEAYNQAGVTTAAVARLDAGVGYSVRLGVSLATDVFPDSAGTSGMAVFGTAHRRRDLLARLALAAWSPPWRGARLGVSGEIARRDSTADTAPGNDYDYRERRLMLLLRWSFAADPWAPKASREKGHVSLDFGRMGEPGGGLDEEGIRELLRLDEELHRDCGCAVGP